MGSPWPSLRRRLRPGLPPTLAVAACCATQAQAQQGQGGRAQELGVQLTATASDPALAVVGPYAALRTSTRTRVAAAAGAGVAGGEAAWRAELLGQFLLNPLVSRGAGVYAAGGVAAVGGAGIGSGGERAYVVVAVGLESRPGAGSGWSVEAGVGGGARIALGWRWRRFKSKHP